MLNKPIKVRTILFTEACPLNCRYCHLKDEENFGTSPPISFETIKEKIETYDKQDDVNKIDTRLLFTGGEPFLFWNEIKEIILKYGHRFSYMFNTSGYLFTEEMIKFLSKYNTHFVLSIDGNEKLTNYLRPVISNPYKVGYFKRLKEILPTFTYYFPQVPFRIIIAPRYADLLYEQYLTADKLGFRYFSFVLDFESRPEASFHNKLWTPKDSDVLLDQLKKISTIICRGFQSDVRRPQIVEFNKIFKYLFEQKDKPFSVDDYPCQVFNGRTLASVNNPNESYCMSAAYPEPQEAKDAINQAYQDANHKCYIDSYCPVFEYCAQNCCPQYTLSHGGFFHFDLLECVTHKCCYEAALYLLDLCNKQCPDSFLYKAYINTFNYKGKKEALTNGANNDFLSL